jgi:deoxyribodipyrimidine photolyase-related protein
MEFFYREMRRASGLLMEGDEPAGGQWNFDHDNRKALPKDVKPPKRLRFEPDAITREVMAMVAQRFPDHFGDLEPFGWAVTREDALEALDHFIAACLPRFGDYQDAMKQGNGFLYHSVISPYLNVGLLTPREVCERRRSGLEERRGSAQCGGGLHPPDPRLAGICARALLAEDAGVCGEQLSEATRRFPPSTGRARRR